MYEGPNAQRLSNASGAPAPTPTESQSHIRDAIFGAESGITELHGVILQLEQRLETVLAPAPPPGAVAPGAPGATPIRSIVQERVVGLNHGCQHAIDRLRDLLRRIEV